MTSDGTLNRKEDKDDLFNATSQPLIFHKTRSCPNELGWKSSVLTARRSSQVVAFLVPTT